METRGLELRSACSCELAKQSRPLIPLFKSPVCLQLRDEVEVKTPRTFKGHANVLAHCMRSKTLVNFKIYEHAYQGE